MKTNRFGFLFLTVTAFLMLCLCVGCNADVNNSGDVKQAFVKFSEDGVSRALDVDEQTLYPIEKLYWAYVAVKKDGLNTLGESEETTVTASDGKIVAVDTDGDGTADKNYVLRAEHKGPSTGLDVEVGPVSYGDWLFLLYGYESWDATNGKFSNLIYTGKTTEKTVRVNAPASGETFTPVNFVLTKESGLATLKGRLAFSSIYLTVPEGMKFYDSSTFTVSLEKTDGTKIAKGTALVSGDAPAGTKIPVYFDFVSGDGTFDAGMVTFNIKISHEKTTAPKDTDINFPEVESVNVFFSAGKVSTLYGDLYNIKTDDAETEAQFGVAVACAGFGSGYREYASLADAVMADNGDVTLLRNVEKGGSAFITKAVVVHTNGYFVKDLTIDAINVDSVVVFRPGDSRSYEFSGYNEGLTSASGLGKGGKSGKLNYFGYSGTTVWIDTDGGSVAADALGDTVYHSGTADFVHIKNVDNDASKGYRLGTSSATLVKLTKGYLEIGGNVNITKLVVEPVSTGVVSVKGNLTSNVSNIFNNDTDLTNGTIGSAGSDKSGAYRTYTLNGNGQKVTGNTVNLCYVYGIEGMYLTLPVFSSASARTTYTTLPQTMHVVPERTNKSQLQFVMWNTATAGTGTVYYDGKRVTVGSSNVTLYALWGAPVGGKLFYIDTSGATNYKFFTKSGSDFTADASAPTTVGTDCSSKWYTLTNTTYSGKDRYYIVNSDCIYRYSAYVNTANGAYIGFTTAARDGVTLEIVYKTSYQGVPDSYLNTIGKGRTNTRYILSYGDDTRFAGSNYTKWYTLKNTINAGDGKAGCTDWYIPCIGEVKKLCDNASSVGLSSYFATSGTIGHVGSSTASDFTQTADGTHTVGTASVLGYTACQCVFSGEHNYSPGGRYGQWWASDLQTGHSGEGTNRRSDTIPIRSF